MEASILQLFPAALRPFWSGISIREERLSEIRLRVGRPILLVENGRELMVDRSGILTLHKERARCVTQEEIQALVQHICHYSVYAFEDEIRQGFITVPGGHRVGLAGQAVLNPDGEIKTIKQISFLNIRISHEVPGAADTVLPYIYEKGVPGNLLILSPPGCGKTTLLRDLIRQISNGNPYGAGMSVGVVDERCELAGAFLGVPQNDLGMRTDVLDACPKALGMMLLLRSMSPQVIAVDELGGSDDFRALLSAAACGCRILATAHADAPDSFFRRNGAMQLWQERLFRHVLLLGKEDGKPVVKRVYGEEEIYAADNWSDYDWDRMSGNGSVLATKAMRTDTGSHDFTEHSGRIDEWN